MALQYTQGDDLGCSSPATFGFVSTFSFSLHIYLVFCKLNCIHVNDVFSFLFLFRLLDSGRLVYATSWESLGSPLSRAHETGIHPTRLLASQM